MAFFNYSSMQMTAKIVYYGPGLGGKTTNLEHIHRRTMEDSRGEMVSLETQTDRTLFFDLLPLDVGTVAGFRTRIQLYTVPGQVFYNTTRKLVLKGVDGVVFVADSQRPMLDANLESLGNLESNLGDLGLSFDSLPVVLQYNKRDLPEVCSVAELERHLNPNGWASFEASALHGHGVFETLKGVSKLTLLALKRQVESGSRSGAAGIAVRGAPQKAAPGAAAAGAAAGNGGATSRHALQLPLGPDELAGAREIHLDLSLRGRRDEIPPELRLLECKISPSTTPGEVRLRLDLALGGKD